ncbi:hypothetical protein Rcas_2635 [Roseiflexus castenholzii DSM 13941]|uniref:Uncharacterized protein n=1 Tax=Roseiflexus castenholzii (strain DSM 13941 / HLO8) TaxID=383372 RepID=A7NME6_ROSCS|nr:hypothetical protein Rcas_2635 [Roseiflexus castenholzii DSM 13941]
MTAHEYKTLTDVFSPVCNYPVSLSAVPAICALQSALCPHNGRARACMAGARALLALVSIIVTIALPLLCVVHCHVLSARDHTTPHPVQFLCHLAPGAGGSFAPPYAAEVSPSPALTLRAVYDCVAAPLLIIVCLLLVHARTSDATARYHCFASPPHPPPPRN